MKAARTKSKVPALTQVPQSREQVAQAIGRIGELEARIAARKAEADEQVRTAGEAFVRDTEQLAAELKDTKAGVQTWCEAHRLEITAQGKVKYAEFGSGKVLWRLRPPKVRFRGAEEVIVDACKRLGLERFVRVKEEVSREAMLAEAETARTIAGVTISSEGEDFVIEPAALEAVAGRG